MSLHRIQTHPEFVEGCFGCKISTLQMNPGDAGRADSMPQKKWDKELDEYKKARAQGIQPAGTTTQKVREAVELSNKVGKAYDANTNSFK